MAYGSPCPGDVSTVPWRDLQWLRFLKPDVNRWPGNSAGDLFGMVK